MDRLLPVCCLAVSIALCSGCEGSTDPDASTIVSAYVHTRASWSPDGKTIAFRGEFNGVAGVHLIDTSGSNRRLLVTGEGVGFAWSPDSRWLAYSALGSLYKIRVNGDSLTRLTTGTRDLRPAWSPDGRQIAFVQTGIWILRLDSLSTRQLTPDGNFPSWHPNGLEVVALTLGQQVTTSGFQHTVDALNEATGQSRTLYSFISSEECGFGSMSPAGDAYLLSSRPREGQSQIWIVNLTTSTPTRLTTDGGDYPAWSPNGTMIVYTRTAEGDGALWLMRPDGSQRRRLTSP